METIPVSMRLSADIRALLGELANRDHRTMAGWVSAVVEREAASAGLNKEEIMVKAKENKVAAVVKSATALPDFIDPDVWADFVEHRKTIKKPINESTLRYMVTDIMKAHHNGWDVNELIAKALAGGWQGFVFDEHRGSRPGGKEIVVKDKLSPAEVAAKKAKLLSYEGLVGHNKDRFVDYDLMVEFVDTAFETDQPLGMSMMAEMIDKFYKSRDKEKCNQFLRNLIYSPEILNDDGDFIAMRNFK